MRRSPVLLALPVLLGPAVLAFAKGGYFDVARLVAGAIACALVVLVAVTQRHPVPAARAPRVALAGLALLTALTAASFAWAPIAGPVADDLQRLILYLACFLVALALLQPPEARRLTEPLILAGIVAAALYGLSERLLPTIFELQLLPSANDRLAWPLTYWNAMGAYLGIGLVLATASRSRAALATAPLLGLALYLTFSRGALGATAAGLAVLLAVAPTKEQTLRLILVGVTSGVAIAATLVLGDVERPGGSAGQGAAMLVLLVVLAAAAYRLAPRPDTARLSILRLAALAALALTLGGTAFMTLRNESHGQPLAVDASPGRLLSVQSNRYEYWRVAIDEFTDHPVLGGGAGSFRVSWLRERPIPESVRDAHSIYLETAAELGLLGVLALALFLGGIVAMAWPGRQPEAAGAIAALALYAAHAALDWDWEMPALTLVALVLAARLAPPPARAAPAPT